MSSDSPVCHLSWPNPNGIDEAANVPAKNGVMDLPKAKTKTPLAKRKVVKPDQPTIARLVRLTNRDFYRCLQVYLGRFGLAAGMWHFLHALTIEDGITLRELSRRVETMEPTTLAQTDRMKALNLIQRKRSRADRRKVLIYLTPHGRRLYKQLLPLADALNEASVEGFSEKEKALIRRLLGRMQSNLEVHLTFLIEDILAEKENFDHPMV
jgi:MarR family transcriptional regulator, organic hydroperoxide resistance regulator